MWVMLISNYALVRILVLKFVIPYARMKVNNHAMKLHPTCGALFGVIYAQCSLMRLFISWLVAFKSFASLHFALSILVFPHEFIIPTYFRYSLAVLIKFLCAIPNFQNKFPFCVPIPPARRWGVVDIFHARCVVLTMSVYSLVIARE